MKRQEQVTYQARLFESRRRLMREVNQSEEALREDMVGPGEVSAVPSHPADAAVEGVDKEVAIAQNEEEILDQVEAALERIEAGTFGTCEDCGREIPIERLDAVPYTPWCKTCAGRHSSGAKPPAK